jgi:predicted lipoprotein with Yx(FWY)xxD motif
MTSPLPSGLALRLQTCALALLHPSRPRTSTHLARFRPAGSRPVLLRSLPVLAVTMGALLAAGCSSSPASKSASTGSGGTPPAAGTSAAPSSVTINAKAVPKLGTILVTSTGLTLYMFVPDKDSKVTCVSLCAATWPPVFVASSGKVTAGPGVQQSLLGSDTDPAGGGKVVTYGGWPLYGYTGDQAAGQLTGQAVDANGGFWYVVNTAGKPVTASAVSG